jgi:quinol monooxygenase YgiN
MHARMTVAYAQPDHFDEARAAVQEAFLPAAQAQPGYAGFLLLTDRETQQLVGISFWESEADMQSSGGTGGYYQQRMDAFAQLLTAPPTTTTHEVAVREP